MPDATGVGRWVLHVDLDQFLAAVEVLRHPELRGRPVVVGGAGDPTQRAVVSTASYEARERGVHSGMPLRVAVRRCPDAVLLPVDKPHYEAVSQQVMATLRTLDAVVEVIGWDEAFLGARTDRPGEVAADAQRRVLAATGLACSVGIGRNKLMAKMATGFGKPAGIFTITPADWFPMFGDRPVEVLHGIGARTAKRLAPLGIRTVQHLAAADPTVLAGEFGPQIGPWIGQIGRGDDRSPVIGDPRVARSRSREITYQRDLTDWDDVRRELSAVVGLVAADVSTEGRPVMRVFVKVRYRNFHTPTHGMKLPEPTSDPVELEQAAQVVLDRFTDRGAVRLIGMRAEFVRD